MKKRLTVLGADTAGTMIVNRLRPCSGTPATVDSTGVDRDDKCGTTATGTLLDLAEADHGHATIGGTQYRDMQNPARCVGVVLERPALPVVRTGAGAGARARRGRASGRRRVRPAPSRRGPRSQAAALRRRARSLEHRRQSSRLFHSAGSYQPAWTRLATRAAPGGSPARTRGRGWLSACERSGLERWTTMREWHVPGLLRAGEMVGL